MELNEAGEVPSPGKPGNIENPRKTPFEIAEGWYQVDDIYRGIMSRVEEPRDTRSREFAEWLTSQYRLAMAKGIQLGRSGSEDYQ